MTSVNPYLTFQGTAAEAFNFYGTVFKAEPSIMKYKDAPAGAMTCTDADANKAMHCALTLSDNNIIMGCDAPDTMGGVVTGNNVTLSVSVDSKEEADRLFQELSSGGQAFMPMGDTFWGAYFGMCKDKYSIQWMIDYHK